MEMRRITINIAGRNYPLNVPAAEEETLRKVGKQIEMMIRQFEANFDVKDKQDALAMCALKLGANAEVHQLNNEKIVQNANDRLTKVNLLLDQIEKQIFLFYKNISYNSSNTLQVNSTLNNYRTNVFAMACCISQITKHRNQFKSC